MDILGVMDVSASGLEYHRKRVEIIALNIANAQVTGRNQAAVPAVFEVVAYPEEGESFDGNPTSITTYDVVRKNVEPRSVYNPGHPDANDAGFIFMPNVNPAEEMTNLMVSSRMYEANIRVMNAAKVMMQKALEIGGR